MLIVGAGLIIYRLRGASTITGEQAKRLVSSGATLIDVRTPSEFSSGHIDGAMNISVDQLAERLADVGDRSGAVVLYCASGARSARAKRILEREGFSNVNNLGGMSRWG
ncbi:MAG: rhodanese-like domain-containing protein [Myxococcales bacterium FL481]|nr:MAG: rhodanese-like domain-containing protein [Myxococcales bacterium FL481]